MRARLAALTAIAALGAAALPAHAAKSTTLFFDNTGSCGTEDPVPSLVTGGAGGTECNPLRAGAAGNGLLGTEDYANSGKKTVGYKVDSARKLTGKVNLVCTGPVSGGGLDFIPGYVGADITISINGVSVGSASGGGPITAPGTGYAVPINMTIPKSLKGKVVKSVIASVEFNAGAGICGVGYTGDMASSFSIPSK